MQGNPVSKSDETRTPDVPASAAAPPDQTTTPPAAAPKLDTPTVSGDDVHLSLRVVGQDGSELLFRLKRHTPLGKMMDAYCQRMAVSRKALRFLYDGQRVPEDATPDALGMTDRDIIDAVLQQVGGVQFTAASWGCATMTCLH